MNTQLKAPYNPCRLPTLLKRLARHLPKQTTSTCHTILTILTDENHNHAPHFNSFLHTHNRWYICEKGKQTWKRGIKEGKFRFEARMIRYDHGVGGYEYVSPVESEWEAKSIFVLADASDIKEVGGRINFILE